MQYLNIPIILKSHEKISFFKLSSVELIYNKQN